MKTSTKVLLAIFIVCLIPSIIFAGNLFSAIVPTEEGFVFDFDVYSYIALGFSIATITLGGILYFRFVFSLKLSKAIFFSVLPMTIFYGFGLYSLAVVGRYTNPIANSVKLTLNISQNNNYNSILWAVLLTGLYLVYIFVTLIVVCRPLQKLEKVTLRLGDGRVREGNFKIGGIKQFQDIEGALEKINYNYKEKENLVKKTDLEAQKFIPKEFLKFLGKTSINDLELGNKVQKRATTLFCDFINPSSGTSMSLKDNFNYVNSYLNLIAPIVRKYDGFIDKYLGDGLLAVFGKAEKAVDCANAIYRIVEEKNKNQFKFPRFNISISISTGDLMFGVVGEENRKSPTIISDVVELASKMQEINKFLGTTIVFSKQTLNEIPTRYNFDYRYIGSLSVDNSSSMALFESFSCYDRVRKEALSKSKTKFENGVRAYNDRDYEEAKEIFESVLRIVPNDRASYIYYNKSCEKISLGK